jgi:hypothetical protein
MVGPMWTGDRYRPWHSIHRAARTRSTLHLDSFERTATRLVPSLPFFSVTVDSLILSMLFLNITRTARMNENLHAPDSEEEDDLDGCDVPVDDDDATSDEDLPPAEGGIG